MPRSTRVPRASRRSAASRRGADGLGRIVGEQPVGDLQERPREGRRCRAASTSRARRAPSPSPRRTSRRTRSRFAPRIEVDGGAGQGLRGSPTAPRRPRSSSPASRASCPSSHRRRGVSCGSGCTSRIVARASELLGRLLGPSPGTTGPERAPRAGFLRAAGRRPRARRPARPGQRLGGLEVRPGGSRSLPSVPSIHAAHPVPPARRAISSPPARPASRGEGRTRCRRGSRRSCCACAGG